MSVTVQLGEVVSINPDSITRNYLYKEIEYIDISSVGSGTLEGTRTIPIERAPSRAKRLVRNGDTILSTVRPNRRSFLFIKNPKPNTVVSTGFAVLRAANRIDERFLYFLVNHQPFTDYLTNSAKGAAYPAVDTDIISNAEIPLPPLPTQRKIAGILSAYDDLIENNTRRISILEEMAQRIYKEWFVDFKYPGHENDEMVESEFGMIPEGWEVKKTEEVMGILGGGTPSTKIPEYWKDGNINWYAPKDLTKSNSMFILESGSKINDLGLRKSSAKLFPEFSVMLTSRATIGVVSINTTEACTNQGFISCVPSEDLSVYQIYFWLLENVKMFKTLASGATFKELTKSTFRKFDLVVPPKDISTTFNDIVNPILNEVLNLQKKQENLRQTRDLLLPKLISGQVDVSKIQIRY